MSKTQVPWPARTPLAVGILALALLIGGFGGWSVSTTVSGVIVASGHVRIDPNREAVRSTEGGVVDDVLVRDGDRVEAGDVVMTLDGSRLRSELAFVDQRLRDIAVHRARLVAEAADAERIAFPDALATTARKDPETRAMMDEEAALFSARLETLRQLESLVETRNEQVVHRIAAVTAQVAAFERQRNLIQRERVGGHGGFAAELHADEVRFASEQELAEIDGEIGRLNAEIAGLRSAVAANRIEHLRYRASRRDEAIRLERELERDALALNATRTDLTDRLSRMHLRAPILGIVHGSQVFAKGATVQLGDPVLHVLPETGPLIVSARVAVADGDQIGLGQQVALRFPTLALSASEPTTGEIVRLAADAATDSVAGSTSYSLDIRPVPSSVENAGAELTPGMPVDVHIGTGDRTALTYLIEPFTSLFTEPSQEQPATHGGV